MLKRSIKRLWRRFAKWFAGKSRSPLNNRKKAGAIFFGLAIVLFLIFAVRILFIADTGKVAGNDLVKQTKALYEGSSVIKANRGSILDRYGNPIAENATSYSVYAILSETYLGLKDEKLYAQSKNFDTLAEILHKYTGITKKEALTTLKKTDAQGHPLYQVEFGSKGKNLTLETKLKIEAAMDSAKVKGLYFEDHPSRLYPNGEFASHFIGYAQQTDNDDDSKGMVGVLGLEAAYNKLLEGKNGKTEFQKDRFGNSIPGTVEKETPAKDGTDIYTTLDSQLQSYLETLLDAADKKDDPASMTAILMDAKTGAIRAISQRPSFNPLTKKGLDEDKEKNTWRNLLVEDAFEPGSTMKAFTTAAAIQEGKYHPEETYSPAAGVNINGVVINDHDFGAKGTLNFQQAFTWSSNVGMIKLEQAMGKDTWRSYLEAFHFGASTNSGLLGESNGQLPSTNEVDTAMSAYGQGIAVTPLQLMQAYTAITNGGQMVKPYYIEKTVNPQTGKESYMKTTNVARPISAETASEVLDLMGKVVTDKNYGTGNAFALDGYSVGAKTGTAQIPSKNGYLTGLTNYVYSVVTVAPLDDPQYICYMTLKQPKAYDGKTIPSVVNPLMKRALESEIENPSVETVKTPDVLDETSDTASEKIKEAGLVPVVLGSGEKVIAQNPKNEADLLQGEKVFLLTDSDKVMPDMTDWTKSDVLKFATLYHLQVESSGQGYVTSQSPTAGEKASGKIKIVLAGKEAAESDQNSATSSTSAETSQEGQDASQDNTNNANENPNSQTTAGESSGQ